MEKIYYDVVDKFDILYQHELDSITTTNARARKLILTYRTHDFKGGKTWTK
jgi:hypothetical protein